MTDLPTDPTPARSLLEARLHLLDHQILDSASRPVGAVDDVEFSELSTDGVLPLDEPAPR